MSRVLCRMEFFEPNHTVEVVAEDEGVIVTISIEGKPYGFFIDRADPAASLGIVTSVQGTPASVGAAIMTILHDEIWRAMMDVKFKP
jgi:hypothetical protein